MDNEITKLDKKFIRLEQIVIDGFARSLENDQAMIKKQDYTNGSIGDAQRERTAIDKEIIQIKTVASVFRVLALAIVVPIASYLLYSFIEITKDITAIEREIVYLQNEQIELKNAGITYKNWLIFY